MGIFRTFWAIYGILLFFLLWLVFSPLYILAFILLPRSAYNYIIWFSHHVYTRLFFFFTMIRIQVEGKEKLNPKQTYIIVSNHRSSVDFMVNAYAYPGVYKFLAKKELVKVPLFGFIVKKLCVLVDRTDPSSRSKSLQYLKKTMDEGFSIFLYPEGTRNRTGKLLGNFHKGAFRIAIETQRPIAIQTLVGIEKISAAAESVDLCPGKVRSIWAEPISTKGLTQKDLPQLVKKVRTIMEELLTSNGYDLNSNSPMIGN